MTQRGNIRRQRTCLSGVDECERLIDVEVASVSGPRGSATGREKPIARLAHKHRVFSLLATEKFPSAQMEMLVLWLSLPKSRLCCDWLRWAAQVRPHWTGLM